MTKQQFIEEIKELINLDDVDLTLDTNLEEIDEYDSFALLSISAFIFENFDIVLKARDLQDVNSIGKIINLIGEDKFD